MMQTLIFLWGGLKAALVVAYFLVPLLAVAGSLAAINAVDSTRRERRMAVGYLLFLGYLVLCFGAAQ